MADHHPQPPPPPSPADVEAAEEITRLYRSLPPRPTIEDVEAAYSLLLAVEEEQTLQLHAISKLRPPSNDSSPELFAVLQETKKGVVKLRSYEQKREAEQVIEMDKIFAELDGLVQKASTLISGEDSTTKPNDVLQKEDDEAVPRPGKSCLKLPDNAGAVEAKKLNLMQLSALIESYARSGKTVMDLRSKLTDKVEWIPSSLGRLSSLTEINLSENKIMALPNSISSLKTLTKLEIVGNNLINLPNTFGELQALTSLDLSSNSLKNLPESFGGLNNLKTLDISTNRFAKLPEIIGDLISLQTLDARTNDIEELPHSIGSCGSLVELRLDFNRLVRLPESLAKLRSLEVLTLHYNRVRRLPSNIGDLPSLREVDVSFNELEGLPESICYASRLEKLNVGKNFADLRSLPENLGNLTMLEELDISDNQIKHLPDSVRFLTNLRHLRADQTPLEVPPRDIVESGAKAVVEYMAAHFSERFAYSRSSKEKKSGLFSCICPLLCVAVDDVDDEASV